MTPQRKEYLDNINFFEKRVREEIAHFKRCIKICKKMLQKLPELKNVDTRMSVYHEHITKRNYYKKCCNNFTKIIKNYKNKLPKG